MLVLKRGQFPPRSAEERRAERLRDLCEELEDRRRDALERLEGARPLLAGGPEGLTGEEGRRYDYARRERTIHEQILWYSELLLAELGSADQKACDLVLASAGLMAWQEKAKEHADAHHIRIIAKELRAHRIGKRERDRRMSEARKKAAETRREQGCPQAKLEEEFRKVRRMWPTSSTSVVVRKVAQTVGRTAHTVNLRLRAILAADRETCKRRLAPKRA